MCTGARPVSIFSRIMRAQAPEADKTLRQEIMALLAEGELGFGELRDALRLSVREMEEELRHVARSLRVMPPCCEGCGFVFRGREPRRFHTPGRCPRCRGERITDARFRIDPDPRRSAARE